MNIRATISPSCMSLRKILTIPRWSLRTALRWVQLQKQLMVVKVWNLLPPFWAYFGFLQSSGFSIYKWEMLGFKVCLLHFLPFSCKVYHEKGVFAKAQLGSWFFEQNILAFCWWHDIFGFLSYIVGLWHITFSVGKNWN